MTGKCACDLVRRSALRSQEMIGVLINRYDPEELDSPKMHAMFIRHLNSLDILINLLDDPTVFMKQIKHVANQHAGIEGLKAEHFTVSLSFIDDRPNLTTDSR